MILWLHFSKSKTIDFNVVYIQQFGVWLGHDLKIRLLLLLLLLLHIEYGITHLYCTNIK